ncbi:MAG: glycosyltransferase family 2 protein [Anaerolineae bacterium]
MTRELTAPAHSGLPLVTIVTPTFNQAAFLERTLQSVLTQDYPNIETIVVAAPSCDGTAAILARYADRVRVISEPDNGQADAINKGLRLARGEIVGWLNSDDVYLPGAISAIVRFFQARPDARFAYGDVLAIDARDRLYGIRAHVRPTNYTDLLTHGDFIVQPAAFWRADLWREVGELNVNLRYAMDYDYWIRASRHTALHYIPVCLAAERFHGAAKTAKGSLARMHEIERLIRDYGGHGLPSGFRAQAAAQLTVHGIRRLIHLDSAGWADVVAAQAMHPEWGVYLRYLAAMLLAGERTVVRFWLLINLLRQRRKLGTVLPPEFMQDI